MRRLTSPSRLALTAGSRWSILAASVASLLALGANRAAAEPLLCELSLHGSDGFPVRGALVTCGGARATFDERTHTYVARGASGSTSPEVLVEVTHPRFVPVRRRLPSPTVTGYWVLRRPDEPFVVYGGVEYPLAVRRDRLLIVLHDTDASGRAADQQQVLDSLARLLARWRLVVAPLATTGAQKHNAMTRCATGWQVVVARADGRDFPDRDNAALAALRAHRYVEAAGPLLRGTDDNAGHSLIDHVIEVPARTRLPAPLVAALWVRGLEIDHSTPSPSIRLPATIGLGAVAVTNQLTAVAPEVGLYLRSRLVACSDGR